MKHTVVIAIGRNVGDTPMFASVWWEFKTSIMESLGVVDATILQRPLLSRVRHTDHQLGFWEGKQEDAATFIATVDEGKLAQLKLLLATDAHIFEQACVGFIAVPGTEHLIHA